MSLEELQKMQKQLNFRENKIFLWFFLFLVVAIGSYLFLRHSNSADGDSKIISINGKKFKIELARSPEEQRKGLGERENLCLDCGMLFVFSQKGEYSFWMKDMRFPLDILWISDDKIIFIAKNIPSDYQGIITPPAPASRVLEINAGLVDKYRIKKKDRVVF